jgi:hypothetical protein
VEACLLAVEQDRALVRDQRTRQRLDQTRLAGAVVADHGQHFPAVQVEVGAVDGGHPAVPLHQATGL